MFDIISAAKDTQWSTFPTLNTKYKHPHVANEDIDFQIVPGKNYFVEFNKKFGFELLRTTHKDGKDVIQRAKKRQFDDLSCGAISKLCGSEIAIGQTTGFIRIFSTQTGDYMPYKFKPDRVGNSVLCLDYSNNDEYLAAVYDSYDINLFSMETNLKTDTFRLEGLSTLVRFHPARKFALAIGSYEGAVTMIDIQTKKKLYANNAAHEAPVPDISMFDSQDVFVSCGYDAKINVYDLRRGALVQQHKQSHPLSSVCVSPCGTFCVAGNLKGDVISYDFRNMSEALAVKRLHDSKVVRVAFVPGLTSGSNTMHDSVISVNSDATSLYKSAASSSALLQASCSVSNRLSTRESFTKSIETETPKPRTCDSWSELMQAPKMHDFSMDSVMQTPSQWSFMSTDRDTHSNWQQSCFVPNQSVVSSSGGGASYQLPVNNDSAERKINTRKERSSSSSLPIESKRRRMTEVHTDLEEITEEGSQIDGMSDDCNTRKKARNINHSEFAAGFAAYIQKQFDSGDVDMASAKADGPMKQQSEALTDDDKENRQNNQQQQYAPSEMSSLLTPTPNRYTKDAKYEKGEMIVMNANELNGLLNQVLDERMTQYQMQIESRLHKWKESARNYMRQRLNQLSGHVNYMQGRYFHSDFNHRYRHQMELEAELDLFDEGFAGLFHTDSVNEQYPIYQADLDDLRRRFQDQQKINQ